MCEVGRWLALKAHEGLLGLTDQLSAANEFSISVAAVEKIALQQGILPARYQRNRQLLSTQDQLHLCQSHVVVVGCGGLGGNVIEGLTRLGVGTLTVIDPDVFEENNLNRQLLSNLANLGTRKVDAAVDRVAQLNPAVKVQPKFQALDKNNGAMLLSGAHVVVDALDSIEVRLELSALCHRLELPLVHAAIGGWYGQATTQLPGRHGLETIYSRNRKQSGLEKNMGNPSFTPAMLAAVEVAETCKILLSRGTPLCDRLLIADLLDMEFDEIPL